MPERRRGYTARTLAMVSVVAVVGAFLPDDIEAWRALGVMVAALAAVLVGYHCGRAEA